MVLVKMQSVCVRFETFVVSGESSTISDVCNYFKLIMQNDKETKGNWIDTLLPPCGDSYHREIPDPAANTQFGDLDRCAQLLDSIYI